DISGVDLEIRWDIGGYVIVDRSGTAKFRGSRFAMKRLNDGDEFDLTHGRLTYEGRPDEVKPGRSARLALRIIAGPERGRRVAAGAPLVLSRAPAVEPLHLAVQDDYLSQPHCAFILRHDRWLVVDCASKNGTFHNDRPVRCTVIAAGDLVRAGTTVFKVERLPRPGRGSLRRRGT
ncbi:FHA domain-containing protein, partial [bacterium]|nr:FHA domain-containing protein [candidate division CSSED10-310 bacterium]